MNPLFRFMLTAAGTWGASIVLSVVLIGVTAAVTQRWSANRMQPVVGVLIGVIVLLFLAGIVFVHSAAKRILMSGGNVWLYTVLYAGGAVLTLVVVGFITLVAMNR